MKKILIILSMILTVQGYSQNLLGYTKEEILTKKGNPSLDGNTDSGNNMITYSCNNNLFEEGYEFTNNTCTVYYLVDSYNKMDNYINILNNNYIIVNDSLWSYNFGTFISVATLTHFDKKFLLFFIRVKPLNKN